MKKKTQMLVHTCTNTNNKCNLLPNIVLKNQNFSFNENPSPFKNKNTEQIYPLRSHKLGFIA